MNPDFAIAPCLPEHLESLLQVESEALAALERPDLLRRNPAEVFDACLRPPHVTLGAWQHDTLVAFAILYCPSAGDPEDLSRSVVGDDRQLKSANFKICIVRPAYRGHHLQVRLGEQLAAIARERGYQQLCATASPCNAASISSLGRLGYRYHRTLQKYGYERNLYLCEL